jgi:hypothetical protein
MKHPTDFRFVLTHYVDGEEDAWASVRAQAIEWTWIAAIMLAVPLTVWWVLRSFYRAFAREWATSIQDIVETYRQRHAAAGMYAPPGSVGTIQTPWVIWWMPVFLMVPGLAVPWLIWAAVWLRCRESAATDNALCAPATFRRMINELLHMYLAYPDDSYRAPAGWHGVWTPDKPLQERRTSVSRLYLSIWAVAIGAAFVAGMLGVFVCRSFLPDVAVVLLVLAHLAGCTLTLWLPRRLMSACIAPALRRVMDQQQRLLPKAATLWEHSVNLVTRSTFETHGFAMRDHVFLGFFPPKSTERDHPCRALDGYDCPDWMPVLIHRDQWRHHMHITGGTQTGKTVLGICGFLCQLLRGYRVYERGVASSLVLGIDGLPIVASHEKMPILVLDFKGDELLRNTLIEECAANGRVLRIFTLEKGKATAYFNPFLDLDIDLTDLVSFCELLCSLLGVYHGVAYGRGYYSKRARDRLIKALRSAERPPRSWEDVYRAVLQFNDPQEDRDVFELVASLMAVASFTVLGNAPAGGESISMSQAIANDEVIYFNLPALGPAFTVRDIGRMALFAWLAAAMKRAKGPLGRKRSLLVMDEAQIICGEQIQTVFQQASEGSVTCVLANQSARDLDAEGVPHMSRIVRDNTRYKQSFSMLDVDEVRIWMTWSGERVGFLPSWTIGPQGTSVTHSGSIQPQLPLNSVWQVNAEANTSLLHVMSNSGFAELWGRPQRVWTPPTMTTEAYERRKRTPWPAAPLTPMPTEATKATVVNPASPEEVTQASHENYSRIEELYRSLAKRLHPHRAGEAEE